MIPLSSLGGPARPPGGGGGGMIPLGALGGSAPPSMAPPMMMPPVGGPAGFGMAGAAPPPMSGAPPAQQTQYKPEDPGDTLAEIGKTAKDYKDVLMPIEIPKAEEDSRPVPKQVQCLENGTDLFKMFDLDMNRFDPKAVKKSYHKMALFVDPKKIGREPSVADQARFTKLKQAYTIVMDEQLRAVYRQYCFGIAGSGGCVAQGHETALANALEMGRDLRKMGEERALVLYKASETGWNERQKDQDGRFTRGDGRKQAHQFNLFGDISSSDDDALLEKERRGMTVEQILAKSPKYADNYLEKVKPILLEPKVSTSAAGGAFTMLAAPKLLELLHESPKTIQKHLRKCRTSLKQMNWAMTSLLQHKDSPWRGLEVKASVGEHGTVKLLEIMKSGIAMGKFNEVHEEEFSKVVDALHRLYMDIFERRGQELLRASISAELMVVYLLPESGGRLPDSTQVTLQELKSRPDLNGKTGTIAGWDFSLQRYNVEVARDEHGRAKGPALPSNPDLLALDDIGDQDEEEPDPEEGGLVLAVPKKIMIMPKNAMVDLEPTRKKLENLVKDWNAWRHRPRSVSASQDAEAVAAALGPPLESMAGYLQDATSAVAAAVSGGKDGADLIAFECREALQGARNLASKLLGEEPQEPPAPPPLNEPLPQMVPVKTDEMSQVLKEAAEVAAMGIELAKRKEKPSGRKRSKSRKRRHHSDDDDDERKKPKYG